MKNLKISRKLKALLAAGSILVLCGYANEQGKTDIEKYYDYNLNGIKTYVREIDGLNLSFLDYKRFLIENELVPADDYERFLEKYKLDDGFYVESLNSNDDGDVWKIVDDKEIKVFSGIAQKSRDYDLNLCEVVNENGEYSFYNFTSYLDYEDDENYFVCLDDPIDLRNPMKVKFYNGKQVNRVKK